MRATALALLLAGCGGATAAATAPAPPPAVEAPPPPAPAPSAELPPSAPPPVASPTPASPPPRSPVAGPFAGAPSSDLTLVDTVGGAGCVPPRSGVVCSVLVGRPAGWKAENAYGQYDLASFYLPRSGHPAGVAYYHAALGAAADASPADFRKDNLFHIAFIDHLTRATWGEPVDVEVGEARLRGKLVEGHGTSVEAADGARDAFALVVDVPGRKSVFFMATWIASMPELATALRDMVKRLPPCTFEAGKGCVAEAARP